MPHRYRLVILRTERARTARGPAVSGGASGVGASLRLRGAARRATPGSRGRSAFPKRVGLLASVVGGVAVSEDRGFDGLVEI